MPLFTPAEFRLGELISQLGFANPFLHERVELERKILGKRFISVRGGVHSRHFHWEHDQVHPNFVAIGEQTQRLVQTLRDRLRNGQKGSDKELALYEDLALYHLYGPQEIHFDQVMLDFEKGVPADVWQSFRVRFREYFEHRDVVLPSHYDAAHVYACFFQIRRGFYHIHRNIFGNSMPAARLRAAVWQSIFTHDLRRYGRGLYQRMADNTTLVLGPSGTGKELVARAIGLSRYLPFDARRKAFDAKLAVAFHPVNLSALAPTLIESELFGHVKGAFTGAIHDRKGRFEECDALGTVFLDEIGDLDASIQVKLLRVLQMREFQRLGEITPRKFAGKVIAATNRDLNAEMHAGRFREDFYYRLCSDVIVTPSLHEQLADCPADLRELTLFIAQSVAGDQAEGLAEEVAAWIRDRLGTDYPWPGNFRELEQCVRNIMVRKEYHPVRGGADSDAISELADDVRKGALTADELESRYFSLVYALSGWNYKEASRRLGRNWRTIKEKVDERYLPARGLAHLE